jgi:hypothetical protein
MAAGHARGCYAQVNIPAVHRSAARSHNARARRRTQSEHEPRRRGSAHLPRAHAAHAAAPRRVAERAVRDDTGAPVTAAPRLEPPQRRLAPRPDPLGRRGTGQRRRPRQRRPRRPRDAHPVRRRHRRRQPRCAALVHRHQTATTPSSRRAEPAAGPRRRRADGREIAEPVGDYPDSIALLRDTIIAAGPRLVVALGNVALRVLTARPHAARRPSPADRPPVPDRSGCRHCSAAATRACSAGLWPPWPRGAAARRWLPAAGTTPGGSPRSTVLPLLHPSAQNMSPFAGEETIFHRRMLQTRDALRAAPCAVLGRSRQARGRIRRSTGSTHCRSGGIGRSRALPLRRAVARRGV